MRADPGQGRPGLGPDFIGIGAQRAGTSWLYACLYEHPQVCMPRKEINFFSRERNWRRGYGWYESVFDECSAAALTGEFSTSYLTDGSSPRRIREHYPEAKLIASLRHPVDRAYSSYRNDIVAGLVDSTTGFRDALRDHPEYVEQGRYAHDLQRYLEHFPREQLLILIFDDARRNPGSAIEQTYLFLGVDPAFRPAMLHRQVGIGRVPRSQRLERWLLGTAAASRGHRWTRSAWWLAKKAGLGDRARALNTRRDRAGVTALDPAFRRTLVRESEPDVRALEELLGRKLPEWRQ
jgi:hypothetical protein